jgi:hypothetical protein
VSEFISFFYFQRIAVGAHFAPELRRSRDATPHKSAGQQECPAARGPF